MYFPHGFLRFRFNPDDAMCVVQASCVNLWRRIFLSILVRDVCLSHLIFTAIICTKSEGLNDTDGNIYASLLIISGILLMF